jgi:ADP-Ribosyltransferase in polyvalent proteins
MKAAQKQPAPPVNAPWANESVSANGAKVKDNFMGWFSGSKVVDAQGAPLRLFHGTTCDFGSFDMDRCRKITMTGAEPRAIFFSNSPEVAQSYCGQRTPDMPTVLPSDDLYDQWRALLKRHGPIGPTREFWDKHCVEALKTYKDGGQVMAVFVSAKKILKVNAKGDSWNEIFYRGEDWDTNHLIAHAREKGYDGVCIRNVHDRAEGKGKPSDVYAFFHAEQIKSAFGNSGLYLKNSKSLDDLQEALLLKAAKRARKAAQTKPLASTKRMLVMA